jgi:hypothetical protein
MERKRMQMEFLHGRPLSPGDLEMIRRQVEEFEVVAALMTKSAASPCATGLTCYRSFRPRKIEVGV